MGWGRLGGGACDQELQEELGGAPGPPRRSVLEMRGSWTDPALLLHGSDSELAPARFPSERSGHSRKEESPRKMLRYKRGAPGGEEKDLEKNSRGNEGSGCTEIPSVHTEEWEACPEGKAPDNVAATEEHLRGEEWRGKRVSDVGDTPLGEASQEGRENLHTGEQRDKQGDMIVNKESVTQIEEKGKNKGESKNNGVFETKALRRNLGDLLVMTLNVRGLQKPHKGEALRQTLHDLKVDIAVITETHLSEEETKRLIIPGFSIEARDCRVGSSYGGVFIAVRETIHFTKVEKHVQIEQPANACTLMIYPTSRNGEPLRITGMYLPPPPTARITPEWVAPLTDPANQSYLEAGRMVSHLFVGDMNQHSWKGGNDVGYHEWLLSAGMWEISDPGRRT